MMNKLKFLRVVYFLPLLLVGLWPVNIPCQQCGTDTYKEILFARIASRFEDNFFCSFDCALDYLDENPREFTDEGEVVPKTSLKIRWSK